MAGPFYNGGEQVHNIDLPGYSEPDALQRLLVHADRALLADIHRMDRDGEFTLDQFVISIDGVSCAFILGAPQVEGLYAFVRHICEENMYELDLKNCKVKGWR